MKRKRSKLWRKGTAMLLAVTMVLGDLGAASAVGPDEVDPGSLLMRNSVLNAVYGDGEGGAKPVSPVIPLAPEPVMAGKPLSWNLLRMVDRNKIPSIYFPDKQVLQMSADGRYIGMNRMELILNEVPARVNHVISVYDRKTGAIDNVEIAENSGIYGPVHFDLSGDARYVAFSYQTQTEDWKESIKVYLFDRETRDLTLITPVEASEDGSETNRVSISDDGRYVAFDSDAPGLVAEDNDDLRDVFVYDRETRETRRISAQPSDMAAYDHDDSMAPSISADGRYIAFQSAGKFVEKDTYGQKNIYVYDREDSSARPQLVSVSTGGAAGEGEGGADSTMPSISADGSVIAFESTAENLDAGDFNGVKDIFVRNRNTETTKLVSVPADGIPFNRESLSPSISRDGRHVGFHLDVMDVGEDNDDENDIPEQAYVADVASGTAYPVTVAEAPYSVVNPSQGPIVGNGGKLVVYLTEYLYPGSEGYAFPRVFIAEQGEAPVWPVGSKLQASNQTADSITLTWPDAVDASGILGYHVYLDGKNIGYVDHKGTGSSTFTAHNLDLKPGMEVPDIELPGMEIPDMELPPGIELPDLKPEFQVEAVNTAYTESYGGPTYKLDGSGGGEIPTGDLRVHWSAENMRYNMVSPGSELNLMAYSEPGKQVAAEMTYSVWKNETEQETRTAAIALTESAAAPGTYTARWKVEDGVSQLAALNFKLTDPAKPGSVLEKAAAKFPVQVAGAVELTFTNPSGASLAGSMLTAMNPQYGEQRMLLPSSDAYTVNGIYPGKDYSFTLRSPDGRHMWGTLEQVRVEGGRRRTATMNVEQPAEVRLQVVDPTGEPAYGLEVQLFGPDQNYINTVYTSGDGWTSWTEYLKAGDKVTAKVNIGERMYEQPANQEILLVPGPNEHVIKLVAPGEGVLEGMVTGPDGKGIRNAHIVSTQTFQGQPVVRSTRSNSEGAYRLSLLEGEAKIEAAEVSYLYEMDGPVTAQVKEGETTTLQLPLKQPSKGIINTEVRLKYLEDTEFGEPVNMEEMAFLTRIESKRTSWWMSGYFQNSHQVHGLPGETVSVCVTGSVPTYMTNCTDVVLDENSNGTAKLFLEEKGARIQGKLAQTHHRWVSGGIYKLKAEGYRSTSSYVGDNDFEADGSFNINVPEAGTYVMELSGALPGSPLKYEYATVQFTVSDRQILQVGSVSFSSKGFFSSYDGNFYNALNSRIVPGGTVTLRAGYKNSSTVDASDAKLFIDIPEGMTPVRDGSGRIVVSGVQLAGDASLVEQTLILPIGTVAQKQSGTLSFQLKIDPAFNKSSAKSSARIRAMMGTEQVEEAIGSVLMDAPLVTLEAPERVAAPADSSTPIMKVSGVAPAGSQVKLYDGKVLVGSTMASSTGFWLMAVQELPEMGDPGVHAMRAEVEAGGVKLQSPVSYVQYDTKKPQLLEIAMAQAPDGRWLTLNVRNGIPSLPYTVVPGNPFQFELKFDKPDEVENVEIYLEGQSGEAIKAVREGGIYRAYTPTDRGALGDIYVAYDVKPQPFAPDTTQPSMEEVREKMPPAMRDFEIEVTAPFELKDGKYSGTVEMTFPQLPGLKMTTKLSMNPNSKYKAAPQEIELAKRSGRPMVNGSVSVTEAEDSFKTVSTGYMPTNVLFPDGVPGGGLKSLLAGKVRALADAEEEPNFDTLTDVSVETFVQYGEGGEDAGTVYKIKKQYEDTMDFAERINKIAYKVEASGMDCLQELPTTVKQAGKALVAVVGGEVAKVALDAWTGAMSITGPGAIAIAGASAVIGDKIDNYVDEQIDSIGTGYNQCREEDDEKKRKRKKVARLKWIYDPSGYVYEAVPANRLSGVKATVLYQDPASKEWIVWDAGPYEQVNPHNTDDQGKYGWDVPAGKWKVVWEKAGYETKSSPELDVPPPHTEVNAGLVSNEAPRVVSVTGVSSAAGSYVDVELTKYVKVTDAAAQVVTVAGADGKPLEGVVEFVAPSDNPADPDGADLAKVLRFKPKADMTPGTTYSIKVTAGLQSYAGVWMTEGHSAAFQVQQLDDQGPAADTVSVEGEGSILRITFNEKLGSTVDASKFQLNDSNDLIRSAVKTMKPNPDGGQAGADGSYEQTVMITLTEPLAPGTQSKLKLAAGAVADTKGNGSSETTMNVTRAATASNNAALASLAVEEGALTPVFDPAVRSYTVKVPLEAEQLHITAGLADPAAKLVIEGVVTAGGTRQTVGIPANGTIDVQVTAADGTTMRGYELKVVREAPGSVGKEAALSGLSVTPGTLTPVFNSGVYAYSVEVEKDVTSLEVTATAKDAKAKSITIAGEAAVSGTAKSTAIPTGGVIDVVVTAEDGVTKLTYKITVIRKTGSGNGGGGDNSGDSSSSSGGGTPAPADPKLTQSEPFTSASGGTGVRVTLRSNEITSAVQSGTDGQKLVVVEVKEQAGEYVLQLTAETLAKLQENQAGVIFRSSGMQAVIPAALLTAAQLPSGALLNFSMGAASASEQTAAFAAAARQSEALRPVGSAVKISMEMVENQKTALLSFSHPIAVELPVQGSSQEAIYRYDVLDGRWSFVWNQRQVSGSRSVIEASTAGTYAAMAYSSPFADMASHWAAADIGWMAQRLLVSGTAAGTFSPDLSVTRAEFAALLVRGLDLQAVASVGYQGFSDVPEDAWYAADVRKAAEAGLLQGVADQRFAPEERITREQMAVLIWRASAYLQPAASQQPSLLALEPFKDKSSISSWAAESAAALLDLGLMQGTAADTFEPQGSATRAQAAVMLKRLLQLGGK